MSHRITYLLAGCLLAAPFQATAQTLPAGTEVKIYGTLLPFMDNVKATGSTTPGLSPANGGATMVSAASYTGLDLPARNRVTSGTSNLGFRGSYKINNDMKVFFQVESAISPDGDAPNAWAARDSGVGLITTWGTVFYGIWDTPYKYPTIFVGPVRGLTTFNNAIMGNPGFNVPATTTQTGRIAGKADAAFNRRQGNSVQYWTPDLGGFTARFAYSANEGKTPATAATPSVSPDLVSALFTYKNGGLSLQVALEQHNDYFGLAQLGGSAGGTLTNTSSKDQGKEFIGSYALASTGTKLSVIVEELTYHTEDTVVGNVNDYKRSAWYTLLQQRWGSHQVWGIYGTAGAGTAARVGGAAATTNGQGVKHYSVGYSYALAPCADIFASTYGTLNDRSASYSLSVSPGTVAPGADLRGFGAGILYTF